MQSISSESSRLSHSHADATLQTTCREQRLSLHVFAWNEGASEAGFERDALYLVRPDGYVALAVAGDLASRLRSFRERFNLRFQDERRAEK